MPNPIHLAIFCSGALLTPMLLTGCGDDSGTRQKPVPEVPDTSVLEQSGAPRVDQDAGVMAENSRGPLLGIEHGECFGYGGLGLRSSARRRTDGGVAPTFEPTREPTKKLVRSADVTLGTPAIRGSLSAEHIAEVVGNHSLELQRCYARGLMKNPALEGNVEIRLIIAKSGAAQMAAVANSTLDNAQVKNCLAQAVRRWTFSKPEGGGIVIVTIPFHLSRSAKQR